MFRSKDHEFYISIPKDRIDSSTHRPILSVCVSLLMFAMLVAGLPVFITKRAITNVENVVIDHKADSLLTSFDVVMDEIS